VKGDKPYMQVGLVMANLENSEVIILVYDKRQEMFNYGMKKRKMESVEYHIWHGFVIDWYY